MVDLRFLLRFTYLKTIWKMPTEKFQNNCGARVTCCSSLGNCSFLNLAGALPRALRCALYVLSGCCAYPGLGRLPAFWDGFPTAVVIYGVMDDLTNNLKIVFSKQTDLAEKNNQ